MSPQEPQRDVVGYGKDAADQPATRSVEYGHRAVASIEVALASIALALGGGTVTGATRASFRIPVARRNVAVGERITLDLTGKLALGQVFLLLSGSVLKSVTWRIPGTAVKSYDSTHGKTRAVPLSAEDESKPRITFHWVDAGVRRTVTATCVVTSAVYRKDVTLTFSATFDVHGPTLDHLRESRRKMQDRGKTRIGTHRAGVPGMLLLEFTGKVRRRTKAGVRRGPGVLWDWKVTMPAAHGGKLKDVQTIYGTRERTGRPAVDAEPVRQVWRIRGQPPISLPGGPPEGYLVVDSTPNEDPGEPRYGGEFPIDLRAGQSTREITGSDRPDSQLGTLQTRHFVHETFKYFVLYKADRPGAIWVPVGKIEWFWRGEAVREKGRWRLRHGSGGVTKPGAPTTEFPEYLSHAGRLEWRDVDGDD